MNLFRTWHLGKSRSGGKSIRCGARRDSRRPLVLEHLESRRMLAVFVVNSTFDTVDAHPGDGVAADANGRTTLRAAIMEANALSGADTIILPAGTYSLQIPGKNEDAASTGDLDITDDLTINGADPATTIISASNLDRVFQVIGSITVSISGVTIRDGSGNSDGGGIYNAGTLNLTNCWVLNNSASASGGGIYTTGTASLDACEVVGNSANTSGNGGAVGGGGIYSTGSLTVLNSSLTGNSVWITSGGAIYAAGALTVTASTLSGNSAYWSGGAIYNTGAAAVLTTCTLDANTCQYGGGAVYNDSGGAMTMAGCNLDGNQVTAGPGGAIFNDASSLHVSDSELSNNTASNNGGAINNWGDLSVSRTVFTANTAPKGDGGAIYNSYTNTEATISDSTFNGDSAQSGGGICNDDEAMTVTGCTFYNNTADFGAGLINSTGAYGMLTLVNCTINGNAASSSGGGLYDGSGAMIDQCTICRNSSPYGGGIGSDGLGWAVVQILNTILAENSASSYGPDSNATFQSLGCNLVGNTTGSYGWLPTDLTNVNPQLGPLQDNGGPTLTCALLPGSPAIDAGNGAEATPTDQRGFPRIQDGNNDGVAVIDIGAVEMSSASNAPIVAVPANAVPDPVTAMTTGLSVLGADQDSGEASLTYTWAATSLPNGVAAPSFSSNGTNAAKNTTATFSGSGNYQFTVTITGSDGLSTTSSVSVTVNQTLSSIDLSPSSITLNAGGSQQFSAIALDQFGVAMAIQPTFTWSATVGVIGNSGLLAAPNTTGSGSVTATGGGVSRTAAVTVTDHAPTVATAAAANPVSVIGTTTSLSVLGADVDTGEASLTYTWVPSIFPNGAAPPVFSSNGSNVAKNTTATFSEAGIYAFTVIILDPGGLLVTSTALVTVNQTVTSIVVASSSMDLGVNGTELFSATAFDQFGSPLVSQPTFIWSASGGGSIDSSGQFTPAYTAGSVMLQATAGTVNGALSVALPGTAEWTGSCDTSWNASSTWTGGGPVGALASPGLRGATGDTVVLAPVTAHTISLNGVSPSIATVTINGSGGTPTLAAGSGGTLHLGNGSQSSTVSVVAGSGVISAPIEADSNLVVSPAAGSTVSIVGGIAGGGKSLAFNGYGTVVLGGNNGYTGGTIVSAGTLVVTSVNALPDGGSLTVGAGGTFSFDPSQAASSSLAAGLAASPPGTTAASKASTLVVAPSALANGPVTASALSPLSPVLERQVKNLSHVAAIPATSGTPWDTPTLMSSVASDAIFASHRSALDQTVLPADNARSARPWAWLAAIESSWKFSDQDKTTDSNVEALDTVLARFEV